MAMTEFSFLLEPASFAAGTTTYQEARLALPLGEFHEMDIAVRCLAYAGTGNITVSFQTCMQNETPAGTSADGTDSGWVTPTGWTSVTLTSAITKASNLTNPLKYTRYKVVVDSGVTTAILHFSGIGRTL